MFNAGDHVPVTPFVDVVGKALNVAPEQIGEIDVKLGVRIEFTVTVAVPEFPVPDCVFASVTETNE